MIIRVKITKVVCALLTKMAFRGYQKGSETGLIVRGIFSADILKGKIDRSVQGSLKSFCN